MATATAAAIAKELYARLQGDPSPTSEAAARSDIVAFLTAKAANNPTDKAQIKAELHTLVKNAASAAAATATGACYYQVGGVGSYCSNDLTESQCASLGGYFTPGQKCMGTTYQALFAEGLLDPPPPPTPPAAGAPLPGAMKI